MITLMEQFNVPQTQAIYTLLTKYSARITYSLTTHDALNTYGRGCTFFASAEVLVEKCRSCHETQWSKPVFNCKHHRFVTDWHKIADAEELDDVKLLIALNQRVAKWLEKIRQ